MILVVSLALMIVLWAFIIKTKLGKAMRAVSDDAVAANVVGINLERTIPLSLAIGSDLAGVVGVLIVVVKILNGILAGTQDD